MSEEDRRKWNARFAEGAYAERTRASQLLQDWVAQAGRGRALDLACGAGRNALYLAALGYTVDAIDIAASGLQRAAKLAAAQGLTINWIEQDLDDAPGVAGPYEIVLQFRYVNASLTRGVAALLAPGGLFICEQHLRSSDAVIGPRNPLYRVGPGELAGQVEGLEVLLCEEGLHTDPDGRRVALARLVARRQP